MNLSVLSDENLARLSQNGDIDAFGELLNRYNKKILNYSRRFIKGDDSFDVVQEVFIKAYVNIRQFDAERRFSPWLYRIAHNELINAVKKRAKEPLNFFDPDTIFPHPTAKETAEDKANKAETKKIVEECLDKINYKYREPLVLYYLEEMDYGEISDILRIPVSTVGVRISRGRNFLRKSCSELKQ